MTLRMAALSIMILSTTALGIMTLHNDTWYKDQKYKENLVNPLYSEGSPLYM
jgi:hypothetical protein